MIQRINQVGKLDGGCNENDGTNEIEEQNTNTHTFKPCGKKIQLTSLILGDARITASVKRQGRV